MTTQKPKKGDHVINTIDGYLNNYDRCFGVVTYVTLDGVTVHYLNGEEVWEPFHALLVIPSNALLSLQRQLNLVFRNENSDQTNIRGAEAGATRSGSSSGG